LIPVSLAYRNRKTENMGVQRTRTVKNKHAANKSGIQNSKASRQPQTDGFVKAKSNKKGPKARQIPANNVAELLRKRKQKKTYTEEELGIPKLNSIRPAGVVKPRGKKKGKVFVDDAVGIYHHSTDFYTAAPYFVLESSGL
jgi:60S ribosomal subunit assembly/export protein LOC1